MCPGNLKWSETALILPVKMSLLCLLNLLAAVSSVRTVQTPFGTPFIYVTRNKKCTNYNFQPYHTIRFMLPSHIVRVTFIR